MRSTPPLARRALAAFAVCVALAVTAAACRKDSVNAAVPLIDVSPLALEYGPVPVGLEVRLPLKLRNAGKQELVIDSIASDVAAFHAVSPPTRVAAGDQVSFDVVFAPTAEGAAAGTLRIQSNADDNPVASVTLDGQGTPRLVCTTCDSPPPNYCTPGNSLVIYSQFGTCVVGKCQYQANTVACSGSCDGARAQCVDAADAGATDAGHPATDAGTDAGAGSDAGSTTDAGTDAGVDAGASTTAVFSTPGATTFTVPAGVTSLTAKAWGGGGAGGNQVGATGGGAGFVKGTFTVTPGEVLDVWVAEGGVGPGNGGGASFVWRAGPSLLLVAAGGGGGGSDGNSGSYTGGRGGAGGGTVGEGGANFVGTIYAYCTSATGGGGATWTDGGVGGTATGSASLVCQGLPGTSQTGGRASGVNSTCDTGPGATAWHQGGGQGNGGGGGGGAGLFGGGGAGFIWTYCAGGGGGGSSFVAFSATGAQNVGGSAQAQGNAAESQGAGVGGDRYVYNVNPGTGGSGRVVFSW